MKRRQTRRPLTSAQRAWIDSPQNASVRRAAQRQGLAELESRPRCGAKRKEDGQPCQMPAMENGRCRLHGGLTPKGENWHRVRYPGPGAPMTKLDKKVREIERRRRQQAAKVAAMTPEQRARYDHWRATHKPGGQSVREVARRDREAAEDFAKLANYQPPANPEVERLETEIAELERRLDELTRMDESEKGLTND